MITDLLNMDSGSETTAHMVANYFAERGVERSAISGDLLRPLYGMLSKSSNTALGGDKDVSILAPADKPVDDKVWGVIAETREHPALEFIIKQFSEQLGIGIQLFHGTANESFIMESKIAELIEQGKVKLTPLKAKTLSLADYNALFLSRAFWDSQLGRKKILVFQTDAILCANSDYQLADFLDFDYIGSKWPRDRPVGMIIDGGNGGLSLRDWHKTVECLDCFSPKMWPGGEDGYFAFHMDLMGGRVGRGDECSRFSTQHEFLNRSFGGHKLTDLDSFSLEQFFQYCPVARQIL